MESIRCLSAWVSSAEEKNHHHILPFPWLTFQSSLSGDPCDGQRLDGIEICDFRNQKLSFLRREGGKYQSVQSSLLGDASGKERNGDGLWSWQNLTLVWKLACEDSSCWELCNALVSALCESLLWVPHANVSQGFQNTLLTLVWCWNNVMEEVQVSPKA